jgi:arsenate reductase (glutaredoxin)
MPPAPVTIYHNPECGTSRNVLALIRNAGIEPHVIEYLKAPPDRATLEAVGNRLASEGHGDLASLARHFVDSMSPARPEHAIRNSLPRPGQARDRVARSR